MTGPSTGTVRRDGWALVPGLDRQLADAVEAAAAEEPRPYGDRHRYQPAHGLGRLLTDPPPRPATRGAPTTTTSSTRGWPEGSTRCPSHRR